MLFNATTDVWTAIAFFTIGMITTKVLGYFWDYWSDPIKEKSKKLRKFNWFYVAFSLFLIGLILYFVPKISFILGINYALYQFIMAIIFLLSFAIFYKKITSRN